jgi:hypothetical protein
VIGFPLNSTPDYEKLEPLFFEHFHKLAVRALEERSTEQLGGLAPAERQFPRL